MSLQGSVSIYAGLGLWQANSSLMAPAVVSLDPATGSVVWTTVLGVGQPGHGGVRSCILDNNDVVCAGYVNEGSGGFKFVADAGTPAVWRLDSGGNLLAEKILSVEGEYKYLPVRLTCLAHLTRDGTGGQDTEGRHQWVCPLLHR